MIEMRRLFGMKRFLLSLALLAGVAAPTFAQTTEAQLRAQFPYSVMAAKIPGLTLSAYNEVIRDVARERSGTASSSRPSQPTYRAPAYEPPTYRRYTPPSPSTTYSNGVGSTTFYNSSDGVTGSSNRLGSTTFYNFSDGTNGTSNQLGSSTFHNFNNSRSGSSVSGSSNRIGSTQFHNFDNGVSGSSTQIGGTTFHNFSNGTSCTSNTIGSTTFTNCY